VRTISGEIVLPPDASAGHAKTVTIEIRDVSEADAPSTVVASKTLHRVALTPGARIPFSFKAPAVPGRRLALRVQIDPASTTRALAGAGGYLTTQSIGVDAEGNVERLEAPVTAI
jgi:putative lipoprotein